MKASPRQLLLGSLAVGAAGALMYANRHQESIRVTFPSEVEVDQPETMSIGFRGMQPGGEYVYVISGTSEQCGYAEDFGQFTFEVPTTWRDESFGTNNRIITLSFNEEVTATCVCDDCQWIVGLVKDDEFIDKDTAHFMVVEPTP